MKPKSLLLIAALTGLTAISASAALTVTSENFQGTGTAVSSSLWFQVTGWTESSAATENYADFGLGTGTNAAPGGTASTAVTPGIGAGGYYYNDIGTRDAFPTLNITGINWRRNNNQASNLGISIYSAPAGTLQPGDGTLITSITGITLRDTDVALAGLVAGANPFNLNFDISAAGATDVLFVLFTNVAGGTPGGGGDFAYFDDLNFALVPEPSAALLGGLGALALLRRRLA